MTISLEDAKQIVCGDRQYFLRVKSPEAAKKPVEFILLYGMKSLDVVRPMVDRMDTDEEDDNDDSLVADRILGAMSIHWGNDDSEIPQEIQEIVDADHPQRRRYQIEEIYEFQKPIPFKPGMPRRWTLEDVSCKKALMANRARLVWQTVSEPLPFPSLLFTQRST